MLNVLKRDQHEIYGKILELQSIVKKLIKTKIILADLEKLKCQEKVLQNFSRLTMKSSYYWKPLKT